MHVPRVFGQGRGVQLGCWRGSDMPLSTNENFNKSQHFGHKNVDVITYFSFFRQARELREPKVAWTAWRCKKEAHAPSSATAVCESGRASG